MSEQMLSGELKEAAYAAVGGVLPLPRKFELWAIRATELETRLAEYENDETPTRRELALVKRKLEAMELSTVCAYCGQRFETDVRNTEVEEHIWKCEDHPLAKLVFEIEAKCKDLDYEAQELLRIAGDGKDDPNLNHASGIHSAIDVIRETIWQEQPNQF